MNFDALVHSIGELHDHLHAQATKAINVSLTLRNWLIGAYIVEFEQRGDDRAAYGEHLLERLADDLERLSIPTCDRRRLSSYRLFFLTYPQVIHVLTADSAGLLKSTTRNAEIRRSATAKSPKAFDFHDLQIWRALTAKSVEQRQQPSAGPIFAPSLNSNIANSRETDPSPETPRHGPAIKTHRACRAHLLKRSSADCPARPSAGTKFNSRRDAEAQGTINQWHSHNRRRTLGQRPAKQPLHPLHPPSRQTLTLRELLGRQGPSPDSRHS